MSLFTISHYGRGGLAFKCDGWGEGGGFWLLNVTGRGGPASKCDGWGGGVLA